MWFKEVRAKDNNGDRINGLLHEGRHGLNGICPEVGSSCVQYSDSPFNSIKRSEGCPSSFVFIILCTQIGV